MKVLIVAGIVDKSSIYREPLGIMSLASAVKHKHKVFVADPSRDDIDKTVSEIKPDLIAYSLRTGFHQRFLDINRKLKEKYDFVSIFGGPHPTFFPQMITEEGVDCVCRGEGDEAFLELLNLLESGGDITKIKNLWVKENNKVHKNDVRELIQNLDTLEFLDRTIFDDYDEVKNSKVRSFITGRGCPFNCSYCFNAGFKQLYKGQRYVRRRSVDHVIRELTDVKEKYGITLALFEDDIFNLDKKWLREFSEKFRKLDLQCIIIGIRVDFMDEEVARLLKEANCIRVSFGIESGSEPIRRIILGRNITNGQVINCARLLRKNGIGFTTENIIAIPTSTLEDDLKTLELNIECKPLFSIAHIMHPYPSTEIFKIAVEQGMFDGDTFDSFGNYYKESPLKIENKTERENLQKLFALTVSFPFLYPHMRRLIRLRLTWLYTLLFTIHKAYVGTKWLPFRRSVKEYLSLFRRYFLSR